MQARLEVQFSLDLNKASVANSFFLFLCSVWEIYEFREEMNRLFTHRDEDRGAAAVPGTLGKCLQGKSGLGEL
jgi:hypothetical protein